MSENRQLVALRQLGIEEELVEKIDDYAITYYELNTLSIRVLLTRMGLKKSEAKELFGALIDKIYKEETIPGPYAYSQKAAAKEAARKKEEEDRRRAELHRARVDALNQNREAVTVFINSLKEFKLSTSCKRVLLINNITSMEALKSLTDEQIRNTYCIGQVLSKSVRIEINFILGSQSTDIDCLFLPNTINNKLRKLGINSAEDLVAKGIPVELKCGKVQKDLLEAAVKQFYSNKTLLGACYSLEYLKGSFESMKSWYNFLNGDGYTCTSYFKLIMNMSQKARELYQVFEREQSKGYNIMTNKWMIEHEGNYEDFFTTLSHSTDLTYIRQEALKFLNNYSYAIANLVAYAEEHYAVK